MCISLIHFHSCIHLVLLWIHFFVLFAIFAAWGLAKEFSSARQVPCLGAKRVRAPQEFVWRFIVWATRSFYLSYPAMPAKRNERISLFQLKDLIATMLTKPSPSLTDTPALELSIAAKEVTQSARESIPRRDHSCDGFWVGWMAWEEKEDRDPWSGWKWHDVIAWIIALSLHLLIICAPYSIVYCLRFILGSLLSALFHGSLLSVLLVHVQYLSSDRGHLPQWLLNMVNDLDLVQCLSR